jgi:hypothetical protein
MSRFLPLGLILLLAFSQAAFAQSCIDYDIYDAGRTYPGARLVVGYVADIQEQDLYSSSGARLQKAAQVMRQDRANVHKFGLGSEMDTHDGFFRSSSNRTLLENARYVTYCSQNIAELKRQIQQASVPGFLDVIVFQMIDSGRYVVFINVVG